MPANGAVVTNLYADTSASVSGADSMLVAVVDNTKAVALLSCTVDSTSKTTACTPAGRVLPGAGDNLEVRVTRRVPAAIKQGGG
jgi:hypothetical protein